MYGDLVSLLWIYFVEQLTFIDNTFLPPPFFTVVFISELYEKSTVVIERTRMWYGGSYSPTAKPRLYSSYEWRCDYTSVSLLESYSWSVTSVIKSSLLLVRWLAKKKVALLNKVLILKSLVLWGLVFYAVFPIKGDF